MPTLRELDAHFIRYEKGIASESLGRPLPDGTTQWGGFEVDVYRRVEALADAQGIWFDCPACYESHGNSSIGVHGVMVSFADRGVLDNQGSHDSEGKPSRWAVSGTGLDDLVLAPSIYLKDCPPCSWHGFVGMSGVPPGSAK